MKKTFLSFAMLLIGGLLLANNYAPMYRVLSVDVKNPILTDSLNAKGEVFKSLDILKTPINVSPTNKKFVNSLGNHVFHQEVCFEKAKENNLIHVLGFETYTDLYIETEFEIVCANMFELYIDGKLVATKSTLQDSVTEQSTFKYMHKFEPMKVYEVAIKLLSQPSDKCSPKVKVDLPAITEESQVRCFAAADRKRFYELTDNFIGTRVARVSISPCGKYALTMYSERFSTKKMSYYNVLTENRTSKVIMPRLAANVKWMPRTSKLYYTEKALVGYEVLTINPNSLEEEVLIESVPEAQFVWSPAEDYLVLTVKEEARKNDSKLTTYHASQYDRVYGRSRTHLAKYDIGTGVSERITFGNYSSQLNDISADGKKLLFTTAVTDYSVRNASLVSLYEVDMQNFDVDTILNNQEFLNQAVYSPDGKELLITAGPEAFDKVGMNCGEHKIPNNYDTQAYILNRESGKVTPITRDFNPAISAVYSWNAGNNNIYVKAENGMCESLYAYDVKANKWQQLTTPESVIRSFSIDNKGVMAVYSGLSMGNSSKAYTYEVKKDKSTLFADPMKDVYDGIELGEVEDFTFKSEDGTDIEGYVCFPPYYDNSKKYPMIVYYYGGTSPSQKWNEFYYGAHLFASRGYIVYVVNPSGTTGYGQEFSARHVNTWGIRTADEIIEGVERVCEKYTSVNKERIGCIGASYGGFMTQYLLTRTDMFAGAVSHAGISNIASYWGEGFWGLGYSYTASAESYPWNNPKLYVEQSPLFSADKITTPLLLVHGGEDTNVPLGESVQMYNALKRLGKTVEFIEVSGEDHTIIRSLDRQILWHNAIMAWFSKTLQVNAQWWDAQYPKVWVE